jgi:hypothetical protein
LIVASGFTVSLAASGPTPALAEQGTEQQREACTPDVFRLCGQFIPDGERIATCLRNSGPRLSPACYTVFYPPQTTGQSAKSQTTGQSNNQSRPVRQQAPVPLTPAQPPADNDDDD